MEPHYRRQAFVKGLERAGYTVGETARPADARDLLVIWNRQGPDELRANEWEQRGGTVVVAENGYFGRDADGRQLYAISVHGHNGSGWFHQGDGDRFTPLCIELAPWRQSGPPLVCAQRGIGSARMASPRQWDQKTVSTLRRMGFAKARVRQHPGRYKVTTPLDQDLAGAGVCVIWSSAAGLRALQLGVPVVYTAPHWIGAEAASRGLGTVLAPLRDDAARLRAMRHAAWGQRTVAEIESGEPFATILEHLAEVKWS